MSGCQSPVFDSKSLTDNSIRSLFVTKIKQTLLSLSLCYAIVTIRIYTERSALGSYLEDMYMKKLFLVLALLSSACLVQTDLQAWAGIDNPGDFCSEGGCTSGYCCDGNHWKIHGAICKTC